MADISEVFKNQKVLENHQARVVKRMIPKKSNELVSALLESIVYDSRKHASFCQAIVNLSSRDASSPIDFNVTEEMTETVTRHLEVEAEMIKNLESVRLATTESWYRDVIEFMIDDEKRHHRILTALSKAFSTGEDRIEKYYRLADTLTDQAVRNSRVRGPP